MADKTNSVHLTPPAVEVSKEQITKNKKLNMRGSAEDILIRIGYIEKAEEELFKKLGYPPSRQQILDEMKRIGFDMNVKMLWRDRSKIQKKQKFFRGLIEEGEFSAIMYHNAELLDYMEEQAIKYLNTKWTNTKNVRKINLDKVKNGDIKNIDAKNLKGTGILEHTSTEELATPKYNFLYILSRVVELRNKIFNEDTMNLDASILSDDYQETKDKNEKLERHVAELEKELKEAIKHAKTPKTERT